MTNQFDSKGGEQNIGQGDHAVGKQVNVTQTVRGDGCIFSGTGNVTVNGISPALFAEYAGKLAVTDSALASFFKILEEQQVPHSDLDSRLREIAGQYKELLARVGGNQAAKQAIERGDYAKAEALLEDVANQHSISAAETYAELARLQRIQLRYAKAAAYWQKAAALLPEENKNERACYLNQAGYDLKRIARYNDALPLYEQSLLIRKKIGDKAGQGTTLNNISQIYHAIGNYTTALIYLEQSLAMQRVIGNRYNEGIIVNNIGNTYYAKGDHDKALSLLEQSLAISRELGDRVGENITLSNIGAVYYARDNYAPALKYLKQSLALFRELGDRSNEGMTLLNISQIYKALGNYAIALKHLEQSLRIAQEIGDRRGEAETSWNIGLAYEDRGDLAKAEAYISRAVQLAEEIGHPSREKYRKELEDIRAELRGQQPGLFARMLQSLLGK